MKAAASGATGRWLWAAGSAVMGVGLIVVFFSLASPSAKPPERGPGPSVVRPAITLSVSAKNEATLLDPAPLFLPTKWNATQTEVAWPEPGGAFQNYRITPKWSFSNSEPKLALPPPVGTPVTPAEALSLDAPGSLTLGFGRAEAKVESLPLRGAFIDLISTGTGLPALPAPAMMDVERLAAESHPPSDRPWQPFEFLAMVDAAGLVGPLVIVEPRSGVEEVDRYFQDFLVRTVRVGARLPPGFYRISVGP